MQGNFVNIVTLSMKLERSGENCAEFFKSGFNAVKRYAHSSVRQSHIAVCEVARYR